MLPWAWVILLATVGNAVSQNLTDPVLVDCPAGDSDSVKGDYILAGSHATCSCKKAEANERGQVQWIRITNETECYIVSVSEYQSILTISTDRQETGPVVYACLVSDNNACLVSDNNACLVSDNNACLVSDNNTSSNLVLYVPQIAYSPDPNSVILSPAANSNFTFDLCPGQPKEVTINCDINFRHVVQVKLLPVLRLHVIDSKADETVFLLANATSVDTGLIRFTKAFPVEYPGKYSVKCNFSNALSRSISQAVSHDIYVREPPSSRPVLTLSMAGQTEILTSTASVLGNSHVSVACQVSGGTPEVSSVTIACDKKDNTEKGTRASIEFDVTRTDAFVCTCGADHVSGCYKGNSSVVITPVYPASIVNFTVNGQSESLTVESGSRINFMCYAAGKITLSLSLVGADKTSLSEVQSLIMNKTFTNVQCDFTGRYYCVAKSKFLATVQLTQRSVDVYVKCLFGPRYPSSQVMPVKVKVGATATVTIQVKGYPAAKSFFLTIPEPNLDVPVSQLKYSVSYQAERNNEPTPYGTVIVNIKDITKNDFVTYKMLISNDSQFEVSFTLVEESTNDDTTSIAIGVSVGALVIIIVTVIVTVVYCRRKRRTLKNTRRNVYDAPRKTQSDTSSTLTENTYIVPCATQPMEVNPYGVPHKGTSGASSSRSYITVIGDPYDTISNGTTVTYETISNGTTFR